MMAVLPVISVMIIFLARMAELRVRRQIDPGRVKEQRTFRLFMVAGVIMMTGGIAEFVLRGKAVAWPWFLAGWTCALYSFYLRHQAIAALGRFWSVHVEIRDHHQLIRSGPFRWLRHPTYFSMILEMLAVALILRAGVSLAATSLLFVPTLRLRLRLEEDALIEKFGPLYLQYQKETPSIFPYRWPCKR